MNLRKLVMSLTRLAAVERLFDRSAAAVLLVLGFAAAAGTAFVGG